MKASVLKTPLHAFHAASGAKMAPFAGYDMPIHYPTGLLQEHTHTRSACGLFDVSHMGQLLLEGAGSAALLEQLTPANLVDLPLSKCQYTVFTQEDGGILDDLIITRVGEEAFYLVVNAARKEHDTAWLNQHLGTGMTLTALTDHALIAVQGPLAEKVLAPLTPYDLSTLAYMHACETTLHGVNVRLTRSGYTGEDGFEISLPSRHALALWEALNAHDDTLPIGLGARDSLRLDAGFPLYGHDMDLTTTPIEATIGWSVRNMRPTFYGHTAILKQKEDGAARVRVGFQVTDKGIAREGAQILSEKGEVIGHVTSGGFSPTLKAAIGQGYIEAAFRAPNTKIQIEIRGRNVLAITHKLAFVSRT